MPQDVDTLSAASVGSHIDLRDHFAAAAMAGLIAEGGDWRLDYIGRPCIRAYQWADAMLRERDKNVPASPASRPAETRASMKERLRALTEDEREAVSLAGSRLSADPMYASVVSVLFRLLKRLG